MTTAEIESLLDRVKAATGPDRELDAEIDVALFGGETVWKQANYTMDMYPASRRQSANHMGGYVNEHVPLFTASIDATVALLERVLPGQAWTLGMNVHHRYWLATFNELDGSYGGDGVVRSNASSGAAKTPPLALLEALLLALLHQASDQGDDRCRIS